jgi:hypothetical protein
MISGEGEEYEVIRSGERGDDQDEKLILLALLFAAILIF